jgi:hypothetical protein
MVEQALSVHQVDREFLAIWAVVEEDIGPEDQTCSDSVGSSLPIKPGEWLGFFAKPILGIYECRARYRLELRKKPLKCRLISVRFISLGNLHERTCTAERSSSKSFFPCGKHRQSRKPRHSCRRAVDRGTNS